MLLNLSGANSDVGVAVRDVATMQFIKWNNAGGIAGREIHFEVYDHKADPRLADSLAREIGEGDFDIIFGPALSSVTEEIVAVAQEAQIPVVSPTASIETMTGRKDVFIRTCALASLQGKMLSDFIQNRDFSNPVLIYDPINKAYAESIVNVVLEVIPEIQVYKISHDTVLSTVSQIQNNTSPDMIGIITASPTAALIVQQLKYLSSDVTFIGSSWTKSGSLIELGGAAIDGMYIITSLESDSQQGLKGQLEKEFKSAFFSQPGMVHELTYDSTEMLYYSLEYLFHNNKPISPENLVNAFQSLGDFQGVNETIVVDEFGDGQRSLKLQIIKNGRYQSVDE